MKWKQLLFTIVLNIFLMLAASIMLEYSNLSERFISLEDTIQEALDMSIMASVNSEEFFSSHYQSVLMSYAGVGDASQNIATEATTLVWVEGTHSFSQVNTYQFAKWYESNRKLPSNGSDINNINNIGNGEPFGLSGYIFHWLYGGVGSDYLSTGLAYANRNASRISEYNDPAVSSKLESRSYANTNFKNFYTNVGYKQETAGYLKEQILGTNSYSLRLQIYPTLTNMGLSWMDSLNEASSQTTSDNLCSSLHIGKSYLGSEKTYYFLTPASLGVTYIPTEVLYPVMLANLDTIVRLNKLSGSKNGTVGADAADILSSASNCLETSVWVNGLNNASWITGVTRRADPNGHAIHVTNGSEKIVTDGLVEFDLSTLEIKVDYFYWNFGNNSPESALLISRLNGTFSPESINSPGASLSTLRSKTLEAFQNQDTSSNVSQFGGADFKSTYANVKDGRIIARVTAKIKVHVPYQSSILQWAAYMFTGTNHFDIKMYNPGGGTINNDGIWYQYTTYFMTSRT